MCVPLSVGTLPPSKAHSLPNSKPRIHYNHYCACFECANAVWYAVISRGAFHQAFCQWFSLTNFISYWNPCIWLAESKLVSENHWQKAWWNAPPVYTNSYNYPVFWIRWCQLFLPCPPPNFYQSEDLDFFFCVCVCVCVPPTPLPQIQINK